MGESAVRLNGLCGGYGSMQVIWDVDMTVQSGQSVVLLGANGAGKSTILRLIMGMLPATKGQVMLFGEEATRLRTDQRAKMGVAYMSEHAVFPSLTVEANVRLGAQRLDRKAVKRQVVESFERFPELAERRRALAGDLSGGQRKLLGVAKCLASKPRLLIMDEPSSGLSPRYVSDIVVRLRDISRSGDLALLIAEQNIAFLELADQVSVVEGGTMRYSGTADGLNNDEKLRAAFFGVASNEEAR